MIVEAYQTLEDRDDVYKVENEGPFKCMSTNAWLGHGYYFWDSNIEWAKEWGKNSYINIGKDFIIGRCKIDLSKKCFDLFGSVEKQLEFQEFVVALIESKLVSEDQITVPNIIHYMKIKDVFPYASIRTADNPPSQKRFYYTSAKKEYSIMNQRVQICVINKTNVILQPFEVVYPLKYV